MENTGTLPREVLRDSKRSSSRSGPLPQGPGELGDGDGAACVTIEL